MLKTIHEIVEASVSGGFWRFVGYWLMIGLILGLIAQVIMYGMKYTVKLINSINSKNINK
jgi:hypothetical protein